MTDTPTRLGALELSPVLDRLDLVAGPVAAGLGALDGTTGVGVAEIDPGAADTAAFCDRYGVSMEESANCVVLAAKRGGATTYAACVVLASTRADVNGAVRRHLGARKVSFAPVTEAVAATEMEHGGITPIGLPAGWPILVDPAVASRPLVVIGSGLRRSKLAVPGALLASLPDAEVVANLAV